jgi:hypothetical protein
MSVSDLEKRTLSTCQIRTKSRKVFKMTIIINNMDIAPKQDQLKISTIIESRSSSKGDDVEMGSSSFQTRPKSAGKPYSGSYQPCRVKWRILTLSRLFPITGTEFIPYVGILKVKRINTKEALHRSFHPIQTANYNGPPLIPYYHHDAHPCRLRCCSDFGASWPHLQVEC